ncbi:tyrosine-type recombinase/integrase [Govanella unica]|uniref:Tyrosine-type recombinase/integrase n=1 Tax=Govanella unica TaxID=2975056 RepID=A0A9X3TVI4_9PROT|nr:tyrosine-type recombinase/integrase [Govania unica]MDA5192521.1 tyrosine-type recombinase/integrase [Govania unica]
MALFLRKKRRAIWTVGGLDVVTVKLKGINKVRKRLVSGEICILYYHRATGKRLPGEPGSSEFIAAYYAAQEAARHKDRHEGTLKALIQGYMESADFLDLRDRTRADYLSQIGKIEIEFGDAPIGALNDSRIRSDFLEWRDRLAKRSKRQADYALTVLARILSWSADRGLLHFNYAYRPKRKYHGDRASKVWLPENIAAFLSKATPEMALALTLAKDTGQRQGDLLRLAWSAYDGRYICLTQSKTNVPVEIPVTRELKRALKAAQDARRQNQIEATTILTRADGQPWKADHFRHEWRRVTKEAGLDGLTFNDLRGTAVTALADANCTVPQIAAITGHSPKSAASILERYLARTRSQADAAIVNLENARRTKTANRSANQGGSGKKDNS